MPWSSLNLEFLTVPHFFVSNFSAEGLEVVTTYLFCYMMIMELGGLFLIAGWVAYTLDHKTFEVLLKYKKSLFKYYFWNFLMNCEAEEV